MCRGGVSKFQCYSTKLGEDIIEVVAHSEFVAMCRFGGYTAIVAHPNEECAIYSRRSNLSKQNIHVVTLYVMDIKKYTVSNVKEHLNSMTIHQMMI